MSDNGNLSRDENFVRDFLAQDSAPISVDREFLERVQQRLSDAAAPVSSTPQKFPAPASAAVPWLTFVAGLVIGGAVMFAATRHQGLDSQGVDRSESVPADESSAAIPLPAPERAASSIADLPSAASSERVATRVAAEHPASPRSATTSHAEVHDDGERVLVQAALTALRNHDINEAELLLQDARTRFPNGIFAEERAWLWVRCAEKRADQNEIANRAHDYIESHPHGVHRLQALRWIPAWRQAAAAPAPGIGETSDRK